MRECYICGNPAYFYYKKGEFDKIPFCSTKCVAEYLNRILGSNFTEEDEVMGYFLTGYEPEAITDDADFKPLKGAYKCCIEGLAHKEGVSERTGNEYDFYSLKLQVVEVLEGDKGVNRKLDKIYNNDKDGQKKLADELFSGGIALDTSSEEAFETSLQDAKDKVISVRTWVRPAMTKNAEGEWVEKEPKEEKQYLKIVKELKLKGLAKPSEETKTEEKDSSEVPF